MKPRWKSVAEFLFGATFAVGAALLIADRLSRPIDSLAVFWIIVYTVAMIALSSFAARAWEEI